MGGVKFDIWGDGESQRFVFYPRGKAFIIFLFCNDCGGGGGFLLYWRMGIIRFWFQTRTGALDGSLIFSYHHLSCILEVIGLFVNVNNIFSSYFVRHNSRTCACVCSRPQATFYVAKRNNIKNKHYCKARYKIFAELSVGQLLF